MKLKNVLLSGLFLSTAFVACTNDDFTEISTPVNNNGAIALGENFTINVDKADALTRAVFNDKFAPTWEKTDTLGAAWVHQVTNFDEETNEVLENGCGNIGSNYGGLYSNHPFELTEGAGTGSAKFQTVTNAFAGAYALYFPYDPSVSKTMESIPVKMKTYELDCKEPLKNVSENMFSYAPVAFVPGGNQTGKFELGQVPVLVRMSFTPDKKLNMNLADGITIKNIVIIATKGGNTVLASEGEIATKTEPGKDNYNGTDNKDLSEIIAYSTVKTTESLFITAKNSDNEDYKLIKEDVATKKEFIFSILPFTDKADQVIVKVVTDKGVFASRIEGGVSDAITAKLKMFENAAKEGEQVRVNIPLDVTDNDKVIYTVEAFKDAWKDACDGKREDALILGTTLKLTEALVCDKAATVTVTGGKLVVPSMNLNYGKNIVFDSELEVKGKLYTSGASVFTAEKLTAKNVEIQGEATIKAAEIEKLTVAATATVNLSAAGNAGKVKTIQVEAGGTVSKPVLGDLILTKNGLEIGSLNSDGNLTLELTDDYINEGTMTMGNLVLEGNRKFINNNSVTLNGAFSGEFENAAGATLNINANSDAMKLTNKPAADGKAAGIVNIAKGATLTAETANIVTNQGVMNVRGELTVTNDGDLVQDDDAALINLYGSKKQDGTVDGGILTFPADAAKLAKGTIVKMNGNAQITGAANDENIALIITNATKIDDTDDIVTTGDAVDLTGVVTLIINGNYTVTDARAAVLGNNHLRLNQGTMTLKGNLNMSTNSKNIIVAGAVKLTSAETGGKILTLQGDKNAVLAGASLTVSGRAKLAGTATIKMLGANSVTVEGTEAEIGSGITRKVVDEL